MTPAEDVTTRIAGALWACFNSDNTLLISSSHRASTWGSLWTTVVDPPNVEPLRRLLCGEQAPVHGILTPTVSVRIDFGSNLMISSTTDLSLGGLQCSIVERADFETLADFIEKNRKA